MDLYVDGTLSAASVNAPGVVETNSGVRMFIGATPTCDETHEQLTPPFCDDPKVSKFFDGLLDDVRIYDRAITDAEVFFLYQATK